MNKIIDRYLTLLRRKRELETSLRDTKDEIQDLVPVVEATLLQNHLRSVKTESGTTVTVGSKLIASGADGKDDLARRLLECEDSRFLVKDSFHDQQFRAWLKERLEKGGYNDSNLKSYLEHKGNGKDPNTDSKTLRQQFLVECLENSGLPRDLVEGIRIWEEPRISVSNL